MGICSNADFGGKFVQTADYGIIAPTNQLRRVERQLSHFEKEIVDTFQQKGNLEKELHNLEELQEELSHSMKFYDFLISRGARVELAQVNAPPTDWSSPLAVFEATLAHEQKVTGLINDLVELALEEHDHASNIFLQWFVSEQVEEEENVGGVLEQLKLMGEAKGGLFMMDRELAKEAPVAEQKKQISSKIKNSEYRSRKSARTPDAETASLIIHETRHSISTNLEFALSVIPAKAGIQWCPDVLDSGFRRSDSHSDIT